MLIRLVHAISFAVRILAQSEQELPGHMSLPNLQHQSDLERISLNWNVGPDMALDNGRLVSKNGVIWSIPRLAGSTNEWTIEYTIRSNGLKSQEGPYSSINDLSFWLVTDSIDEVDDEHIKFDGFRIAVNNHQKSGLKLFTSDGSKLMKADLEDTIGNCLFNYYDSQVPLTVRLSYSSEKNWFKVQVDNNLCLKTDKIKIPTTNPDFRFGITTTSASQEEWELFKLNLWSYVTPDAQDDRALILSSPIRIVKQDGEQQDFNRASLMERGRNQQTEIEGQKAPQGQIAQQWSSYDVLAKISAIESKLQSKDGEISKKYNSLESFIEILKSDISTLKERFTSQQMELLGAIQNTNDMLLAQLKESHYETTQLTKKLDLLLESREETSQFNTFNNKLNPPKSVDTVIYWILIPIVVGVIVAALSIYKLRKEIKRSKLL